ncbi:unnamed protein product [Arabidopsis lyrata]|uniref:Predicted protein n=1 Tax=Arabidopsis lyrata subsp. lyrata TaxID=81972 RepID=D7L7M6_ARALL|nr:predicted protein [Arabidopsis lyrata subsp. lyrata]CAH8262709.1 unnamed protein product [Arabidopsis lyrata]
MFWGNLFSRVSKWFDSAKNMLHNLVSPMVERVQESFSSLISTLRGFFDTIITKLRNFFAAVFSKLRDFFLMIVAKICNFFVTIISKVRSFFDFVATLYRCIQKLQKLFSLINDLLDILGLESEMALHSKFLHVLQIFKQFGDLGTIFGQWFNTESLFT